MDPIERPLRFKPYYKSVLWGGDHIAALKRTPIDIPQLGESWEISTIPGCESVVVGDTPLAGKTLTELIEEYGEKLLGTEVFRKYGTKFPLLVKLIDARYDLSLQVHPDDETARRHNLPCGKTEIWYIIKSYPGAKIMCGFSKPTDACEVRRRIADGSLLDIVNASDAMAGQLYYVPGGTIHAIGAGNLLAEVQQMSDTTYRIFDYNRRDADGNLRELHIDDALEALKFTPGAPRSANLSVCESTTKGAIDCAHFKVDVINLDGMKSYDAKHYGLTFSILLTTERELTVNTPGGSMRCRQGSTMLIPAAIERFNITGRGKGLLIYC